MSNKLKLNDSNFAMWRALIALAYADHKLTTQEVEFFKNQLGKLELTEAQKETLSNDLRGAVKLSDVYDDITEPGHRTNLLNMAYVIFHRDKNFSMIEKNIYDDLYEKHLKSIGATKLTDSTKAEAQKKIEDWDKQRVKAEAGTTTFLEDIASYFSWLI